MRSVMCGLVVVGCLCLANQVQADDPKPSKYAPANELMEQLQDMVKKLDADLTEKESYAEEHEARVMMNANTVAAIALVLGMHDQDNPVKKKAAKVIGAAQDLASNSDEFDGAQKSLIALKATIESDEKSDPVKWESVADIIELMKQVPIANNNLRRGVTNRRFERAKARTAAYASGLAALAQASLHDDTYCGDEEDFAKWKKYCAEMRDGASQTREAVLRGDQDAAKRALEIVAKTCDKCHEDFR